MFVTTMLLFSHIPKGVGMQGIGRLSRLRFPKGVLHKVFIQGDSADGTASQSKVTRDKVSALSLGLEYVGPNLCSG